MNEPQTEQTSRMPQLSVEIEDAAYRFVDSMIERADAKFPFPSWHGWALREAFIAGANHACANIPDPASALEKAREALEEAGSTILTARKKLPEANGRSFILMTDGREVSAQEMCDITLAQINAALAALPAPENKPTTL